MRRLERAYSRERIRFGISFAARSLAGTIVGYGARRRIRARVLPAAFPNCVLTCNFSQARVPGSAGRIFLAPCRHCMIMLGVSRLEVAMFALLTAYPRGYVFVAERGSRDDDTETNVHRLGGDPCLSRTRRPRLWRVRCLFFPAGPDRPRDRDLRDLWHIGLQWR